MLVNLYTDIEYLLTYAGQYKAAYSKVENLIEKQKEKDGKVDVSTPEGQALVTLTDTLRIQAYKVAMRIKAVSRNIGMNFPDKFNEHFQELWKGVILEPSSVDTFVEDLMQVLADQAFSSAIVSASKTLQGLGE